MKYTKYEKARIIGARALQLSMGAPFMLAISKKKLKELRYDTIEIAKLEYEKGVVPITVRRNIRGENGKNQDNPGQTDHPPSD